MSLLKRIGRNREICQTCLLLFLVGAFGLEAQSPRVAFVTSVNGTGNLGSWADAGGETGVDAGDAICRARAAAGGLANASSFVAWLSTSTDDAYCRLHGFSGTKASYCGQGELPVEAGPWNRTDGAPFSESNDRLLNPERLVFYPLAADEFGNFVAGATFTGTYVDGTWLPSFGTCSEWTTSSPAIARGGNTTRGSGGWTSAGDRPCDATAHLLCFEPGSGPAVFLPNETGNLVFVTSVNGSGYLGGWADAGGETGLDAADAICQARATAAALPDASTYKAWISDTTTDAIDRFQHLGPVTRPDGVKVAHSLGDLVDGQLLASINVTETDVYLGNSSAWTATDTSGRLSGSSCTEWTSNSSGISARAGATNGTGTSWTTEWTTPCSSTIPRLYCIGDSSVIFSSSFLFGDTSAWSDTVP